MSSIPQEGRIILEYTPGDFFYLSHAANLPSKETCASYHSKPPDCKNVEKTGQNAQICLEHALCKNKYLVEKVHNKQSVHSGEDVKWRDINMQYSDEMLKTFNLIVGIILSGVFIYYNRPSST